MIVFITGVSKGIGEALALFYLGKGEKVVGIGRSHALNHPNFEFLSCDLSDVSEVEKLSFEIGNQDSVLFINNAGLIGNIQRISDQKVLDIQEVMQVNFQAPAVFMHKISRICGDSISLTVVNISSGAGKRPIASWAGYCASKAALDLFSETFYVEEQEKERNTKVYSVAPGVIDTDMQKKIRSARVEDFSMSQRFHDLKATNGLATPTEIAERIDFLLHKPYTGEVICSLPELSSL